MSLFPLGKGVVKRDGKQVAILCFGTLLATAQQVADKLNLSLCDMRFVKPIDAELIERMTASHELLVTLEENARAGGAGSAVAEFLNEHGLQIPLLQLGFSDEFVDHNSQKRQLSEQGLDATGIETAINQRLSLLQTGSPDISLLAR